MATTDAISVACKQLGFGADIYWGADRSKYDKNNTPEDTSTINDNANHETISQRDANILIRLVEKKGLDITKVFNVPVKQLTREQYVSALNQLEKLKDK